MCSAERFVLTLWTSDPDIARTADAADIDRIGIDLENLGKRERQAERGTWISPHLEEDLDRLRPELRSARLFARVNPINPDSAREIESVLSRGAKVLMLPMVKDAGETSEFVRLVARRATVVLLVEHEAAIRRLEEIVTVAGVDEVHIGLNDLSISLGLRNRWMALATDLVADAGVIVRNAGLRFGIGGIGRAGDRNLPVPSDLIYAEYARTGATAALISRSFFGPAGVDLKSEIARARRALAEWKERTTGEIAAAHAELARCVEKAAVW